MPELPEVETVKEVLKKQLLNKKIIDVKIYYPKIINNLDEFNNIINQTIIDIKRRGKWLMFELNDYYLLSHLRMEGKYNLKKSNEPLEKHEHIVFNLNDLELRYKDVRKFGRMELVSKINVYNKKPISELGIEPFDLNLTYLKEKFKNKNIAIKKVLLDQKIIAGIGNIYADEILFLSKINPFKKANQLNDKELKLIIAKTKKVLKEAISLGGTTIKSYTSSSGIKGNYQNKLLVYGKKQCFNCSRPLLKTKIGGRTTYYCLNCQK